MSIIGISIGSRSVGLAVLQHGELIDSRTKRFECAWSKQKQTKILTSIHAYILRFNGEHLRIYIPSRITNELSQFVSSLLSLTLPTITFTHQDISIYLPFIENKQQFRNHIGRLFPELSLLITKTSQEKMFEAVWISSLNIQKQ